MKRFFAFAMLVLVFASCDNAGDGTAEIKDSIDSIKNLKVESVEEAAEAATDTIEKSHDSLKEVVDSLGEKAKDSLNQIKK